MKPLPEPPTGYTRIDTECPKCKAKRQLVIPTQGIPNVGAILKPSDGFGELTICHRCRHAGMMNLTSRPAQPPPKGPVGWNTNKNETDQ